jgi:copper chaperone CopZ
MKFLMVLIFPVFVFAGEVTVKVPGMVCGFCAQGIEKNLKTDSKVSGVKIDLESKNVKFNVKDGEDLSNDKIRELLKDSGFEIEDSSIQRSTNPSKK